jgi:hypothetical protein
MKLNTQKYAQFKQIWQQTLRNGGAEAGSGSPVFERNFRPVGSGDSGTGQPAQGKGILGIQAQKEVAPTHPIFKAVADKYKTQDQLVKTDPILNLKKDVPIQTVGS